MKILLPLSLLLYSISILGDKAFSLTNYQIEKTCRKEKRKSTCIKDLKERKLVKRYLENSGKNIVEISLNQMESFAGNIIQLGDKKNKIIVISKSAYLSLNKEQKNILSREYKIITIPITVIQKCGGGSVRCMIAELI